MDLASTITMTATLTSSINIKAVFELIPIVHPRNADATKFLHPKNTRDKIPYFGVENIIVCVKYINKIRGIRQNKKHMNNVISVDLQAYNKNINLKLARNNLQLTGATSDTMGKNAFIVLCSHLNMLQEKVNYIRSLSEEVKHHTVKWVMDNTMPVMVKDKLCIPNFNYEKILKESETNSLLDDQLAIFLWQFSDEFDNYRDFSDKIKAVLEICYSDEPIILEGEEVTIDTWKISNSVYNYTINEDNEISLIGLSKYLHKKGFSVQFHNWNSRHLKVSIPILDSMESMENLDDESVDSDETFETKTTKSSTSNKIKAHRFSIHRGGSSIKQTSPSDSKSALEARNILLEAISEYEE
jgi:hypothetical protein